MPATGKQDIPKWVAVSAGICCYRPRHRFLLEGEMCGEEVDLTEPVLGSLTVQQSHLPLQSVDLVLHRYNYLALARQAYISHANSVKSDVTDIASGWRCAQIRGSSKSRR